MHSMLANVELELQAERLGTACGQQSLVTSTCEVLQFCVRCSLVRILYKYSARFFSEIGRAKTESRLDLDPFFREEIR